MPTHAILALILTFTVFQPDETLRRYGAADRLWELETLQGAAFAPVATITFPRRNVVEGRGPCNSYRSANTTPYPWFKLGPIAATRRACPDLAKEKAFFAALRQATIAIVEGETLTLSDEEQTLMVFTTRD